VPFGPRKKPTGRVEPGVAPVGATRRCQCPILRHGQKTRVWCSLSKKRGHRQGDYAIEWQRPRKINATDRFFKFAGQIVRRGDHSGRPIWSSAPLFPRVWAGGAKRVALAAYTAGDPTGVPAGNSKSQDRVERRRVFGPRAADCEVLPTRARMGAPFAGPGLGLRAPFVGREFRLTSPDAQTEFGGTAMRIFSMPFTKARAIGRKQPKL